MAACRAGSYALKIFDLSFSDGRTCRVIDPDPEGNAEESLRGYQSMFQPGYLVGMVQVVAPPPTKLPWKRDGSKWRIGDFGLMKNTASNEFILSWPGGALVSKSKDEISAAVRENWHLHA